MNLNDTSWEPVARGRRGEILLDKSTTPWTAKKMAIKQDTSGALLKEASILSYLKKKGITFVPQIISQIKDGFTYEWIDGVHFVDVFNKATNIEKKQLLLGLLDKAYALDQVGIIHGELLRPYTNVLVDGESISIIDFERGSFHDYSGKNCKHVMQRFQTIGLLGVTRVREISQLEVGQMHETLTQLVASSDSKLSITPTESFGIQSLDALLDEGLGDSRSFGLWNVISTICLIALLVGIDQYTKYRFVSLSKHSENSLITPSYNYGIAWGIDIPQLIIVVLSVILLFGIAIYYKSQVPSLRKSGSLLSLFAMKGGLLFLFAGGFGNLLDRISLGKVRDFIDISEFIPYIQWPIFNFADIVVFLGVALLLMYEFKFSDIE